MKKLDLAKVMKKEQKLIEQKIFQLLEHLVVEQKVQLKQ